MSERRIEVDASTLLCLPSEEDAKELFRVVDANRSYLREWLPWLDLHTSVEASLGFVRACSERERTLGAFTGLIWYEGELSGVAGFNSIDRMNRSGQIGYWLARAVQGRGIMTACCRALIDYGFDADHGLDLHRIAIGVAPENHKSRAIPERLGFREEGRVRDAEWLYDHFVDHVLYGLLRSEWQAAEPG